MMCSWMLCNVVTCCQGLLHAVYCCYTLHCVVEFYAAVLNVAMYSCMLCSVVTCSFVLLNSVQQCYML